MSRTFGALAMGTHKRIPSSLYRQGVSRIAKAKVPEFKRMNINVPTDLHNSFKAATAAQGVDMTTVLLEYIENYVARHGSAAPKQKGRRG